MLQFFRRIVVVLAVALCVTYVLQGVMSRDQKLPENAEQFEPTRPVTVQDVLDADIPSPIIEAVSFPEFSYRQAFPDGKAAAGDILEIKAFGEAPMLADMDGMPAEWRSHYPETLPPVAQRLPVNPAVVRGWDGLGKYGGVMHRSTNETIRIAEKLMPESFTRFDPSGRLVPALAWKWEVADGNRVFTFYLRQGHKWSDGEPFTTDDILWVCNNLIGSAYWASLPNWMQSTDGRAQLYTTCILDWPRFIQRLREEITRTKQSGSPTIGGQLEIIHARAMEDAIAAVERDPDSETLHRQLLDLLNVAFRDKRFYRSEIFEGVDTDSEKAKLERIGASRLTRSQIERLILLYERDALVSMHAATPDEMDETMLGKLGLLMFRAAYHDCVDMARVRRVKIEAVPDENGDASHIVRFTFPRPNSIFLEKTATFMFFRGIFVLSKHYTAPLHPDGSNLINTIDILDWGRFAETLKADGRSNADTPAGRLWRRMAESVREKIASEPPTNESSKPYKQEIVDAVNAALRSRDYYSPEAWRDVTYADEYADLISIGFVKLRRSRADLNRCRQLLVRADLLKRVEAEGLNSLSDDDMYTLNRMMFRASFDRLNDPEAPIMAYNRENALNIQAANHPRHYTSWVNLMRSLGNYHPEYNRHYPTLRPWRTISEKSDKKSVLIRNPYYYRVDEAGNQLPYIDAIETAQETEESIRLLKMSSGNIDFQVANLSFENYTYLKEHEQAGHYRIRLWAPDSNGGVTFYPAQARKDPDYGKLQDDPRFRHALSLALNRQEIIDVCLDGMAQPTQFSVPKGSKYYSEYHATMSVEYDPDKANRLLDDMGLDVRDAEGFRMFPGGERSIVMNVDVADQTISQMVMMACEYWRKIGLNIKMQLRSGTVISRMIGTGDLDIGASRDGASYFGPLLAGGYAPTHPAECGQWGPWTSYIREGGRAGWPAPQRLREIDMLWENVLGAPNEEEKIENWKILSRRTADDLPRIGVFTSPGTLVYTGRRIRNVPKLSLAGWIAHSPGNCCPEIFWLERDESGSTDRQQEK